MKSGITRGPVGELLSHITPVSFRLAHYAPLFAKQD